MANSGFSFGSPTYNPLTGNYEMIFDTPPESGAVATADPFDASSSIPAGTSPSDTANDNGQPDNISQTSKREHFDELFTIFYLNIFCIYYF